MNKLIILNGSLGSGKSTLANAYAERHPMTLVLDIDKVWFMISKWRNNKNVSSPLAKEMGISMARIHLSAGHDVIIPQLVQGDELINSFNDLAREVAAEFYEIMISLTKEDALNRYNDRQKMSDYPEGYKPDLSMDQEAKEKRFVEMYDQMIATSEGRPNTFRLEPKNNQVDADVVALEKMVGWRMESGD